MNLIEVFLPLRGKDGKKFDCELYSRVRQELVQRFNGITTYSRAPAEGIWKDNDSPSEKDEIVIYEVMTETLDEPWWTDYLKELEIRFQQDSIMARVSIVRVL